MVVIKKAIEFFQSLLFKLRGVIKLIIIKEDMKLGIKNKVTFREAWVGLLNTRRLSRIELNYLLLSNIRIMDERFSYRRSLG